MIEADRRFDNCARLICGKIGTKLLKMNLDNKSVTQVEIVKEEVSPTIISNHWAIGIFA